METISSPFLLSLIAIVVVVAIGLFAKSIYTNRSLDLKRISIDKQIENPPKRMEEVSLL